MLVIPEIFEALEQRAASAPNSRIFKTPHHDLFIEVSKLAHQQAEAGELGFSLTNKKTKETTLFPFTAYVWTMRGPQARQLSQEFTDIWYAAADPANFTQNVRCEQQADIVPLHIQGLTNQHIQTLGRRLASIDTDLRLIVGDDQTTMIDLYTNAVENNREHLPTHSHAVMNETWLQDGTIITDDDGDNPEQTLQASRLFMPPHTYHRPPIAKLGEVTLFDPRISMISNACTYG